MNNVLLGIMPAVVNSNRDDVNLCSFKKNYLLWKNDLSLFLLNNTKLHDTLYVVFNKLRDTQTYLTKVARYDNIHLESNVVSKIDLISKIDSEKDGFIEFLISEYVKWYRELA